MASVHITKAAVSSAYMFVQYVEILSALSDSTDVLNLLSTPSSERQNVNLKIKGLVGFESAANRVLDNAEAKGFAPKYCSVSVLRFPILEIIAYDTADPAKFFPAVHAEFAEKYYANPPPNTIPVFFAGNVGESYVPVVMARQRVEVQPASPQERTPEEYPELPPDELEQPPDNIGGDTEFETLD